MRKNKALILQVAICSEMENVDNDQKKINTILAQQKCSATDV